MENGKLREQGQRLGQGQGQEQEQEQEQEQAQEQEQEQEQGLELPNCYGDNPLCKMGSVHMSRPEEGRCCSK
jgi:hypothetical protein